MRFLSLYEPAGSVVPTPEHVAAMGKLIEESMKSGVLLATGGFLTDPKIFRVRSTKGKVSVIDGPFAEAKELVGGFALLEAKSREEAIELARQFLKVAGDGECEIHQLMDDQ